MAQARYVTTNETEDVAGSIRHALRCAEMVSEDPQAWKWGILALHSALQGACICHLTTTAGLGAVQNKEEWLSYLNTPDEEKDKKRPETRLMALPDLLKAVRKQGSSGGSSNGEAISINDNELTWLQRIHKEIRNQFIHFEPMGWRIEVSGIPSLAQLTARIIKDIHGRGWAFRHLDPVKKEIMILDLERLAKSTWSI